MYPPSGVVPFKGLARLIAPLCYLYPHPAEVHGVFKALYARLFRKLHALDDDAFPRPAFPGLLAAFEDVRVSLLHAREKAWEDYFDRENPQPMDERIGNEASLARMTALGAVEAVCYQLARAAGEVDNLGLPPPKVER